jgi:hypothetical protein
MGAALERLRSEIEQRKLAKPETDKAEEIWSIKILGLVRVAEAAVKLVEPAVAIRVRMEADPTKIHIWFEDRRWGIVQQHGADIVFTCESDGKIWGSQRPFRLTKDWDAHKWRRAHDLGPVRTISEERFEEAVADFFAWALWGQGCGMKPLI